MSEQLQEKDLNKLKRSELLEIMLAQSEEIDRLREELAKKDAELQDRTIKIGQAGSIAEASLALTKVFEEAQKAADLYLANVAPNRAQGVQRSQAGSVTNAGGVTTIPHAETGVTRQNGATYVQLSGGTSGPAAVRSVSSDVDATNVLKPSLVASRVNDGQSTSSQGSARKGSAGSGPARKLGKHFSS